MQKRYIGTGSISLADGRVLFSGGEADLSDKDVKANEHLADVLVDVEKAPQDKPAGRSNKEQ